MNFKEFLLLNWKNFSIIAIAWILSVILHNVISGLFKIEETFFFILAVIVIPIYFLVSLLFSILYAIVSFSFKKGKKKAREKSKEKGN